MVHPAGKVVKHINRPVLLQGKAREGGGRKAAPNTVRDVSAKNPPMGIGNLPWSSSLLNMLGSVDHIAGSSMGADNESMLSSLNLSEFGAKAEILQPNKNILAKI